METKPFSDLSTGLKAEIIAYIEANQPSIYWDRNDELSKEQIEKIFKEEDGLNDVENELFDDNSDYRYTLALELKSEVKSEFRSRIVSELGGTDDDDGQDEWEEEFKDFCDDYIGVDVDIETLMSNARGQVFFYDTCVEFGDQYSVRARDRYNDIRKIKKTLGIKTKGFDKRIVELLDNASYGGRLVVYILADLATLHKSLQNVTDKTTIAFKGDVSIALIDTSGGSGYDISINHEFELPFIRDNFFFEDTIKYNYSWAVCGMVHDWCSGTKWEFKEKRSKREIAKSSLNAAIDTDREYKRIFASGTCSHGDMDMNRHRNTVYINSYPCGTRCKDCGTFWVD